MWIWKTYDTAASALPGDLWEKRKKKKKKTMRNGGGPDGACARTMNGHHGNGTGQMLNGGRADGRVLVSLWTVGQETHLD